VLHALFHYEDGVVVKSSYPRAPIGLGRIVDGKIIRPKSVTFSFNPAPVTVAEQKKIFAWIEDCNRAIHLAPVGE